MGNPSSGIVSVLSFECPRCGQEQADDFELLDPYVPTDWRCLGCHRLFSVLLIECPHCASETVNVALDGAEQPSPCDVVCAGCGRNGRHHEADEGPEL